MNKNIFFRNADANVDNGGAAQTIVAPTPAGNVNNNPIVERKPETSTFIGTVADVSSPLRRGDREYRMVTFVDENNRSSSQPISENFYLSNKDRIAPDVTLNVTIEKTIKGVTTWKDRETEVVSYHQSTGDNIRNVVKATGNQAKMGLLNQLEEKLKGYSEQPALLGAMAQLYGSVLR